MEIEKMQEELIKIFEDYNKRNNLKHNPDTTFHHLVEEVGELSREIQKDKNDWRKEGFDKEKLADEVNDVICECLILAKDYDVDITKAFSRKILEWRKRLNLD